MRNTWYELLTKDLIFLLTEEKKRIPHISITFMAYKLDMHSLEPTLCAML